jgi:hypothetical protein
LPARGRDTLATLEAADEFENRLLTFGQHVFI